MSDNLVRTDIQIKIFEVPKKYRYDLKEPITSDSVKNYIFNRILWIKGIFNDTINLSDSNTIDTIYFDKISNFDSSLDSLPVSLEYLEFHNDSDFSQQINNLPQGLKTLIMGYEFNEHVDNLPDSLINLILIGSFNHPVDNLPTGLETLVLGEKFNQHVGNLPNGLKKLVLSNNFAKSLDNLPQNLIYLQFDNNYNWVGNLNNFPDSIQFLFLDLYSFDYSKEPVLNSLPKSIKYLEIITKQHSLFDCSNKKILFSRTEIEKSHGNYLNKYNLIFI